MIFNSKVIDSFYDKYENDSVSLVAIQNKWGRFVSTVYCLPEDMDIENKWDGQYFAEIKANIQSLYSKYKVMKERARGVETAYNNLAQGNDENDPIMKKLYRQVMVARREAKNIKYQYETMKEKFPEFTDKILNERRNFRKKQEDKENFLKEIEETTN